jgi:hypothetical protein
MKPWEASLWLIGSLALGGMGVVAPVFHAGMLRDTRSQLPPEPPPRKDLLALNNLAALPQSSSAIRVQWDAPAERIDRVILERSVDGQSGSRVIEVPSNCSFWIDEDLVPGTAYHYQAVAVLGADKSPATEVTATTSKVPGPPPPPAPRPLEGLQAKALSDTEIELTWKDPNDGKSRVLLERTAHGKDGPKSEPVAAPNVAGTREGFHWRDTRLTPGQRYSYRLRVKVGDQVSEAREVTATTTLHLKPLEGLVARPLSEREIELTWKDPSDGKNLLLVERAIHGKDGLKFEPVAPTDVARSDGVFHWVDKGLMPGHTYSYRLRVKVEDLQADAREVTATTRPLPPADLKAMAVEFGANWGPEIEVSWPAITAGAGDLVLERSEDGFKTVKALPVKIGAKALIDQDVRPGTAYAYRARLRVNGSESDNSPVVEVSTRAAGLKGDVLVLVLYTESVDRKVVQEPLDKVAQKLGDRLIGKDVQVLHTKGRVPWARLGDEIAKVEDNKAEELFKHAHQEMRAVKAAGASDAFRVVLVWLSDKPAPVKAEVFPFDEDRKRFFLCYFGAVENAAAIKKLIPFSQDRMAPPDRVKGQLEDRVLNLAGGNP